MVHDTERIHLYAKNIAGAIAKTRPSSDELCQLLETEMSRLVGECVTASNAARARGVVIGVIGTVIMLVCVIAAVYGVQIALMLMQLLRYG